MINIPGFLSNKDTAQEAKRPQRDVAKDTAGAEKLDADAANERKLMMQQQEGLLLDYVQRLEKFRKNREAMHLHLSRLHPQNQREPQLRAAAKAFDLLVEDNRAQVFSMFRGDVIVVFASKNRDEVEAALVRIRFMLDDDPLLDDETDTTDRFTTWYNLDSDYAAFLRLAQQFYAEQEDRRRADIEIAQSTYDPARRTQSGRALKPLTPTVLGKLEDALSRTDLSNLIRHQAVSAIVGRSHPQQMYSEVFVSINDLRDIFVPDIDITSDTWLFQHLTETLDRRVLALMSAGQDRSLSGGFSVNLNVRTILSEDFLNFDDSIPGSLRGAIVLEVQLFDILSNVGAFLFARDFAKERGYRICIDGVTVDTLALVNRNKIGADLIKLVWNDTLIDVAKADDDHPIAAALGRCGRKRVILTRVDSEDEIAVGQDLGLSIFQGRGVERMIQKKGLRK